MSCSAGRPYTNRVRHGTPRWRTCSVHAPFEAPLELATHRVGSNCTAASSQSATVDATYTASTSPDVSAACSVAQRSAAFVGPEWLYPTTIVCSDIHARCTALATMPNAPSTQARGGLCVDPRAFAAPRWPAGRAPTRGRLRTPRSVPWQPMPTRGRHRRRGAHAPRRGINVALPAAAIMRAALANVPLRPSWYGVASRPRRCSICFVIDISTEAPSTASRRATGRSVRGEHSTAAAPASRTRCP